MHYSLLIGLLAVLLLAGCDTPSALEPEALDDVLTQTLTAEEHALLQTQGVDVEAQGLAFDLSSAPLLTVGDEARAGRSRLIRFRDGIVTSIKARDLEPGILPDDPRLGPSGPNTCANIQFAIHEP